MRKKTLQKHLPETMRIVISGSWTKKQTLPLACLSLLVSALQKNQTYDSWIWEGLWRQIRDKHHPCPRSNSVAQFSWHPAFPLCFFSGFPSIIVRATRTGGMMVERSPGRVLPVRLCCVPYAPHGPHRLCDLLLFSSLPMIFQWWQLLTIQNSSFYLFFLLEMTERENLMSVVHLFIIIEVELIYNVMLVSGAQKNDSYPKGRNVE